LEFLEYQKKEEDMERRLEKFPLWVMKDSRLSLEE